LRVSNIKKSAYPALLAATLALLACSPEQAALQPRPAGQLQALQPATTLLRPAEIAALEAEYAVFSTQALSQSYLERKVRTLIANNDGEGLRREIEFAEYKHPELLIAVIQASPELYEAAAAVPEIQAYQQQNPGFADYLQQLASAALGESMLYATGYEASYQNGVSVAMAADGRSVSVYPEDSDIYAQRYGTTGNPEGIPFQVNTWTTGMQNRPVAAMNDQGLFVIAWESPLQDGDGTGIFAQRYDASGNPLGAEFRVNTYTTGAQNRPALAMDSNGNFMIAWESQDQDGDSWGIYAQRYDAAGSSLGAEFPVNTYTIGQQSAPALAMNADGNAVIAWIGEGSGGLGLYAQRYNQVGQALNTEFQVNNYQHLVPPAVAMAETGDFVIVSAANIFDGMIHAQLYDSQGETLGAAFQVDTGINNHLVPYSYRRIDVAMNKTGDFLVAWDINPNSESSVVYLRHYTATGQAKGEAFQLSESNNNTYALLSPAVALADHGRFAVSWVIAPHPL